MYFQIEVNKYKLIKSKYYVLNINNSLKTVNKELPKNTNSLEISNIFFNTNNIIV